MLLLGQIGLVLQQCTGKAKEEEIYIAIKSVNFLPDSIRCACLLNPLSKILDKNLSSLNWDIHIGSFCRYHGSTLISASLSG